MRRSTLCVAVATAALLSMTGPAIASGPTPNGDCAAHGRLTTSYSVAQLQAALQSMPADEKEYTNCYSQIQRALLAKLPGSSHPGGTPDGSSSGSFLSAPVIVAIVIVALGAGGAGAVALRRRNQPSADQ
jgi:hypothetical protein